jgi:hypothetical protein
MTYLQYQVGCFCLRNASAHISCRNWAAARVFPRDAVFARGGRLTAPAGGSGLTRGNGATNSLVRPSAGRASERGQSGAAEPSGLRGLRGGHEQLPGPRRLAPGQRPPWVPEARPCRCSRPAPPQMPRNSAGPASHAGSSWRLRPKRSLHGCHLRRRAGGGSERGTDGVLAVVVSEPRLFRAAAPVQRLGVQFGGSSGRRRLCGGPLPGGTRRPCSAFLHVRAAWTSSAGGAPAFRMA